MNLEMVIRVHLAQKILCEFYISLAMFVPHFIYYSSSVFFTQTWKCGDVTNFNNATGRVIENKLWSGWSYKYVDIIYTFSI